MMTPERRVLRLRAIQMTADDIPQAVVARLLDVPRSTIRGWVRRPDPARRLATQVARVQRLRALHMYHVWGYTGSQISRLLDRPHATVHDWLSRGRTIPAKVNRPTCDLCLVILGKDGQTVNEGSDEMIPGLEHSDPKDTRCRVCRVEYGDGPAAAILARFGISSPEETTMEEAA